MCVFDSSVQKTCAWSGLDASPRTDPSTFFFVEHRTGLL
jgi:hypothetical protein